MGVEINVNESLPFLYIKQKINKLTTTHSQWKIMMHNDVQNMVEAFFVRRTLASLFLIALINDYRYI